MIFTISFWKGAGERAVKTAAQVAAAYFVVGTTGIIGFDWIGLGSITAGAAVASLLTSIGSADFVAGEPKVVLAVTDPKHAGDPE